MFHGVSAWLLVWFFPTSVFGVGVSFWLRLFLIFAYLYLFVNMVTALERRRVCTVMDQNVAEIDNHDNCEN